MNSLQTSQLVIIRIDAQTKEQPCIATVHNLVIAKLFGPTCQNNVFNQPNHPPRATQSARKTTKREITIENWMEYLYKVTLVALITRGNETVYFAFDLVLLVILFWGRRSAETLLFWGKNMEKGGLFGTRWVKMLGGCARGGNGTSYGSYHFDSRVLDCRFCTRMNFICSPCVSEC